jgi:hypothetical protein
MASKITEGLIDVRLANLIVEMIAAAGGRYKHGNLRFKCPECNQKLRPHGGDSPHFEHVKRNKGCSLSHKAPSKKIPPVEN